MKLQTTYAPMEATLADELPVGEQWAYEPKWDGFRCLAFRDGDQVDMQSKSSQPLARYFPEVVKNLLAIEAPQFVLDGELVIPVGESFSFDWLLQRIHPAASRIKKLSTEYPAVFVVFDILAGADGKSLTSLTQRERRVELEKFAAEHFDGAHGIALSPVTKDLAQAKEWLGAIGKEGMCDGVVAKRVDLPYMSGDRSGMRKVKLQRTADCVIGGFRYAEKGGGVGSLLLGLYDDDGLLNHIGFTSGIKAAEKKALLDILEPLIEAPGFTGKAPGGPSRWSTERSMEWKPLKPQLVVEVSYDHFTGGRFRHGTQILRWRPDKAPEQCTMDQIKSAEGGARLLQGG
jgi:ATP-dependent DNA ligase